MDNEDPPALKRPRTREDFYLFCTYVLEHENYNRQEEPRQSTSPMDSAGLVSDSNLSSGQEDSNKPTDEDTDVDSESYDLVTCYCNKPFAGRPMIECSNCLTWVHLSCAKIRKKHIPEVFYCAICKSSGNQNLSSSGISSGSSINGNSIVGGGGDNSGSNSPNTAFVPINPQPSPPTSPSAIAVSSPTSNQTSTSTPTPINTAPPPATSPITTQKTNRNNNYNKTMKISSSIKSYKNTTLDNHNNTSLNTNDNGLTRVRGSNTHAQQQYVKLTHSSLGGKNYNKHNINRLNMTTHQKSTTSTNASTGGGYKRTPHS